MSKIEIIITFFVFVYFFIQLWVWAMTSPDPKSIFSADNHTVVKNWQTRTGATLGVGVGFLIGGWWLAAGLAFAAALCIVGAARTANKAWGQ